MTTLYIVKRYDTEIYTIEAEKITAHTYTYLWNGKPTRSPLHNTYDDAYPTWDEAHGAILRRVQSALEANRKDLIRLEKMLEKVQAMTKPNEVQP